MAPRWPSLQEHSRKLCTNPPFPSPTKAGVAVPERKRSKSPLLVRCCRGPNHHYVQPDRSLSFCSREQARHRLTALLLKMDRTQTSRGTPRWQERTRKGNHLVQKREPLGRSDTVVSSIRVFPRPRDKRSDKETNSSRAVTANPTSRGIHPSFRWCIGERDEL